jgi:hypothetical protein
VGFAPKHYVLGSSPTLESDPLIVHYTKPDKDVDPRGAYLDLRYPEMAVKNGVNVPLPHPGGISGGGIFTVPHLEKTQIWSPDRYRLAGINILVSDSGLQIIGLKMYYWLRL